jgi:hypothetical protein
MIKFSQIDYIGIYISIYKIQQKCLQQGLYFTQWD